MILRTIKSWIESADNLVKFWEEQESQWPTSADYLDMNPLYRGWWDIMHNTGKASKESVSALTESYSDMNPYFKEWTNIFMDCFIDGWYVPATSEAARRYYSAKQFHTFGAPNVATGILPWSIFGKYFDLQRHQIFYLDLTINIFLHTLLKKPWNSLLILQ